jgi:hypothetical protein
VAKTAVPLIVLAVAVQAKLLMAHRLGVETG